MFKIGDKVRVKQNADKIESKSSISFFNPMLKFIGKEITISEVRKDCVYAHDWFWDLEWIEPLKKSWETLEVGDIIVYGDNAEAKVLAVLGDTFLRSISNSFDEVSSWYTKTEAQKRGWKIKDADEEGIIEMTLEDIATLKGVDVSKIRIKE